MALQPLAAKTAPYAGCKVRSCTLPDKGLRVSPVFAVDAGIYRNQ